MITGLSADLFWTAFRLRPAGMPQIEVTFDIDANGILTVTAKDKATGKTQNITIKDSSALSKEEIERMKKEAEAHATEDRKRKETIDLRNQADNLIYTTEKTLRDFGDKVSGDDKKAIEEKVAELKKVKDGSDSSIIKKAMDELSVAVQKIGEQMYKAQAEQQKGSAEEKKDDKNNEGPIEGEFKEKK